MEGGGGGVEKEDYGDRGGTSQVQSDSQTPEFLHCQQRRNDVRSILVVN